MGAQIVDNGCMSNTNSKTFLIQTGTSHNGWMPTYSKVEVPASALCPHCNGYGFYDLNIPECEACEGRGHTLGEGGLHSLPATPCPVR